MKSLLYIAFIFLVIAKVSNGGDNCSQKAEKADKCAKAVIFIGEEIVVPHTSQEYDKYCDRARKSYKCVRDYRHCLTKFPRQVFNVFTDGIRKVMRKNCDKKTQKNEILGYLKCYTADSLRPMYKCLEVGLMRIMYIANYSSDDKIITDTCCASNLLKDCVLDEIVKRCPQNGTEAAKFTEDILNIAIKDVIDLACNRYATTKDCDQRYVKGMEKLRKIGTGANVKLEKTFLVEPLLKIAERLIA